MDAKTPLFVMAQPAWFEWPVKVPVPLAGKYVFAEFTARFPDMSADDLDVLLGVGKPDADRPSDKAVAERVLLGWTDLKQPDGSQLPFSRENMDALLKAPRVAQAVTGTFLMAVRGLAAEKN